MGWSIGSDGSKQEVRAEAEAAAHLNHLNIVAIYEIGELGQNYFSMEYVQGGRLPKLCGNIRCLRRVLRVMFESLPRRFIMLTRVESSSSTSCALCDRRLKYIVHPTGYPKLGGPMAFKDLSSPQQSVQLLQRSLERGRLGHAYLFTGDQLDGLERIARTLAKTLNCEHPVRKNGAAIDCCDRCLACQKIEHLNHPDVHWVRPESKSRIITIAQMRDLMREIQLKPTEATHKVAVVVAADRLRTEGANAFLKTLEEPPAGSILILLSTEPQRVLETIVSRCLRLSFGAPGPAALDNDQRQWLQSFSEIAAKPQTSLMSRYRLLDVLLRKLSALRAAVEQALGNRSPLQQYPDAEKNLVERWEDELTAAIEAEYRRLRSDLLALLQWWLRDVWVQTLEKRRGKQHGRAEAPTPNPTALQGTSSSTLLSFPSLRGTADVAQRISPVEALDNLDVLEQLQRWLNSNVQEALALEVGMLRLHL